MLYHHQTFSKGAISQTRNSVSYLHAVTLLIYNKQRVERERERSDGRAGPEDFLEFLGLGVVVLGEWTGREGGDLQDKVRSRELIEEGSHVVAAHTLPMGALSSNLATLQKRKKRLQKSHFFISREGKSEKP